MARYSFNWLGRLTNWSRNQIYIISALFIVAAIIALLFWQYPFSGNKSAGRLTAEEKAVTLPEPKLKAETPQIITTQAIEPQAEPNLISLSSPVSAGASLPPHKRGNTIQSNPQVTELITAAVEMVKEQPGKVIEARDRLNDMLLMPMSTQQRALIKEQLARLSEQWLFSKSLFPDDKLCSSYKVAPGEQLRTIGERYKVPYEILMQINNIRRPQELQAEQTIKVIYGPFHAKVYRSTFTMDLYLQNTYVRSFPVGLGQPGRETLTGLWRVKKGGKAEKPTWRDPDSGRLYKPIDLDYPLGSRWIELEGIEGSAKGQIGFGIHGTKEPETIGTAGSRGCIRLHNGDAILLYNLLVPIHSLVRVEE